MNELKKGMIVVWVSFGVNIILFALKLWAGHVTDSLALRADGWHTLSDCISTVIVMAGMKWSMKPADREHPFGHGRAETVAAIFVGFFLILISFEFGKEATQRLISHKGAHYGLIGVIVMSVSVIVKEIMSQFSIRTGRKIHSDALIADGWHHRSDAISSLIILVGIFFSGKIWWIDGVLTAMLAIYLIYVSYKIIKNAVLPLLGEAVDDEIIEKMEKIGKEIYGRDMHMHHFHIHKYGRHTEMTFHIVLPEEMTLRESSTLTRKLFDKIKKETGIIVTIHVDTHSKYEKKE